MNFESMPELEWKYSYLVFWILLFALSMAVLSLFRRYGFWDMS